MLREDVLLGYAFLSLGRALCVNNCSGNRGNQNKMADLEAKRRVNCRTTMLTGAFERIEYFLELGHVELIDREDSVIILLLKVFQRDFKEGRLSVS
jgi:hypothetical protein